MKPVGHHSVAGCHLQSVDGFRVRVNGNDNKDRIRVHDDVGVMMNNLMVRLISIAGLRA